MAQAPTVLIVTSSLSLPGSVVSWVLHEFSDKAPSCDCLAIVTRAASQLGGQLPFNFSSLDAVISLAETAGYHTTEMLSTIANALRPGGSLIVQEAVRMMSSLSQNKHPDIQAEAELQRSLLLAGFIELTAADALKDFESQHMITIRALKPNWEVGEAFEIKRPLTLQGENKKDVVSHAEESITEGKGNGTANLILPYPLMDTDDLVDEDALLGEEDVKTSELKSAADTCEAVNPVRKACKNCTCGRADQEQKGKLTAEQLNNPQSTCGNCCLGDAFRCNSCPYRGLPPFKLGEKISLPESLLAVDA